MQNENLQNEELIEYLYSLESDYRKQYKVAEREAERNWTQFFSGLSHSEMKLTLLAKVRDWFEVKRIAEAQMNQIVNETAKEIRNPEQRKYAVMLLTISQQQEIEKANTHLKRLERYLREIDTTIQKRDSKKLDVERAKQIPIESVASRYLELRNCSSNKLTCKCPFHEERTPSFFIFTNTNTFKCFGCQAGGDAITFVMKLLNVGFPDAVNYLNSNF